jgi:Pectate lyase superfamily protein
MSGQGERRASEFMSRAALLRGAGLSVAGLAGPGLIGGSAALAGALASSAPGAVRGVYPVFDVTVFGAKGDSQTDDSEAIQAAVDAAGVQHGGVVWIPPGVYQIRSTITVSNQVMIAGCGWNPWDSGGRGSILYVTGHEGSALTILGGGTVVRDIAIKHDQPSPGPGWSPIHYDYAIHIKQSDVWLENILMLNPTRGIGIDGSPPAPNPFAVGRVYLNG